MDAYAVWLTHRRQVDTFYPPRLCCCYVLSAGDRCLYVGQTIDLAKRIYFHQIQYGRIAGHDTHVRPENLSLHAIELEREQLKDYERELIRALRPRLNVHWNRGARG